MISPYVGVLTVRAPYPFEHARHEVDEILEVPLDHLLDSSNVFRDVRRLGEHEIEMQSYRFGDHVIWGATARILRRFLDLFCGERVFWAPNYSVPLEQNEDCPAFRDGLR